MALVRCTTTAAVVANSAKKRIPITSERDVKPIQKNLTPTIEHARTHVRNHNLALGKCNDSIEELQALIEYLTRWGEGR